MPGYIETDMEIRSLYISNIRDPFINLAVEYYLFLNMKDNEECLILYVNAPCAVIGRHQNPLTECVIPELIREDVRLVRRFSGGGTVYHDQGNLNFSFLSQIREGGKERNFNIITGSFQKYGVDLQSSERGDLFLNGKKVSGSAYRYQKKRFLHHGTLLISTPSEYVSRYLLKTPPEFIVSKAVSSKPAPVCSIASVFPEIDINKAMELISIEYGASNKKIIDIDSELVAFSEEFYRQLISWEWIWGNTPDFYVLKNNAALRFHKGSLTFPNPGGESMINIKIGPEYIKDAENIINKQLTNINHKANYYREILKMLINLIK